MLPEELQAPAESPVPRLTGTVSATNLTLEDEAGVRTVESATFRFEVTERVALVGGAGSGNDDVARLLARLAQPPPGLVTIGEHDLASLPESVTGRRLGYVGSHVALIAGTIRDNLHYGLKHRPMRPAGNAEDADGDRQWFVFEAQRSGNTTSYPDDDWIDYAEAGVAGQQEFADRALDVLSLVDLEPGLFGLGLRGALASGERSDLAGRILHARRVLRERLQDRRYAGLVESFDDERYNRNMSVAENLLFGLPLGDTFDLERLSEHPYVQQVLEQVGLREEFFAIGLRTAKIMVDLFRDLPPGHEFFERFSFISSDDLPEYQAAIRRIEAEGLAATAPADRNLLSSLPFKLIPARHRLGLFGESIENRLLQARRAFAGGLPPELRHAVAFFDPDAYNPAASVQDNILFGKLVYGRQQAQREIGALIARVVEELGLRREIVDLGLDFEVGIGGSRLSAAHRQRLGLARALIKRPDLLVIDHATAALDPAGQAAILARLLREPIGAGLVWVMNDIAQAEPFDRIILMEGGRVLQQGSAREVIADQQTRAAEAAAS